MRKILLSVCLLAALSFPCRCGPTPGGGPTPSGERIAFSSYHAGQAEIYVMNADGSGLIRLTNNPADDWDFSWSPDGKRIAFVSFRDDNWEIYVLNADPSAGSGQSSSGLKNLTNSPDYDEKNPAWSPDGKRIAFTRVTDTNRNGYIDAQDTGEIYVMKSDGSRQKKLTDDLANDYVPSWSPDGKRIAFQSDRDGNQEIYVMNANGSGPTNLTNNLANDWNFSCSPDGTRIAFDSDRDGNREIYVMNADGSGVTRLTNNPAEDREPSWSWDGTRITFDSDRDGNREVYVMNADGSGQRNLTNSPAPDAFPSWGP